MTSRVDPALLPTFADIEDAARHIGAACIVTPLLESPVINDRIGGRLLVKAEGIQRTGSFKMRGAYNRMRLLSADERTRGVVAYSSGNHGQAVAACARLLGTTATVVMPADVPRTKVDKTRAWGAEVVFYDRQKDDRVAIGKRLAAERGLTLVPPFEDRYVMAGAGTVALETVQQAAAMGVTLDAMIACCSGGGLAAGTGLVMRTLVPDAEVLAAEPAGFDDTARSLQAGERVSNAPGLTSICDSVLAPTPGELTFEVNRVHLTGAVAVTDAEVIDAMRTAFRDLGLVAEPGGAVALAAVLTGHYDARGRTVAVTLSGSNVDLDAAFRWMASPAA
jgi:threonine dehydratase